ncbi:MAG TPA: hypothetical protein PLZ24_16525, partial [Flavobacteriales bacterium]|nr:hypothetical protein [Flavobacteriales bacterium]
MRVLLPIIVHELTHCIERAFIEEGHEVLVVDWRQKFREKRRSEVEDFCIQQAKAFKPDFAFCQFQTHGVITHRFPQLLKSMG